MSDKVLSGEDLEDLLLTWQKTYGTEHTNKVGNVYYKIKDMRTALNALVNTLISIGYSHEDLKSSLLSKQIQTAVTPHKYEGKLTEWRLMIAKQWKSAVNDFFPFEGIKEAKELEVADKPTVVIKKPTEQVVFIERPLIDKSKIKGLVLPEYIEDDFDPLEFLKKGKKNE
jgi:hypothetical protein